MESVFQFTNPSLLGLEFKVNGEFDNSNQKEIKINLKVETQVSRGEDDAFVKLCVTVGEDTDKVPFYVYAVEGAHFK